MDVAAETTGEGRRVRYTFRRAHETSGFHQFPLIGESKLRSEADERGISLPLSPLAELERFDREGAFSPILFETVGIDREAVVVFRDEHGFVPWSEYALSAGGVEEPRPRYSPWQLLYLNEAVELPTVNVSIEWLLDDAQRQRINPLARDRWGMQLERWRALEGSWRDVLLVLIRLQSRYGPSVKGTLTKSTVSLIRNPNTGEYVDPRALDSTLDAQGVLTELSVDIDQLKAMHDRLVWHGMRADPLRYWHMLFRMAPFEQRARLRGAARRAQDAYDAAEMLRLFHYDLTGGLLLAPDDQYDLSDKSWKKRLFGRWPMRRYTRADLAVELRRHQLHPHEVHLAVEGETEREVCRRVLEEIAGMSLDEMGVTMHSLHGVGGLRMELLGALRVYPRFMILIADREGDIAREAERLKKEGVLTDETTLLWDTSFEEANFSDEELVEMIAAAGIKGGTQLQLDGPTLRRRFDEHRAKAGAQARGLKTFAIGLAGQPAYGSVVVSKPKLAAAMADLILSDLRDRTADAVGVDRPIVSMLMAVLRAT